MTVKELVNKLLEHDPDTEIAIHWEGGFCDPGEFKIESIKHGHEPHEVSTALVIDADEYGSYNHRHRVALGLQRSESEMELDA